MQIQDGASNTIQQRIQRAQIETRYQNSKQLDSIGNSHQGEQVEISSTARDLGRLMGSLREEAARLPDVRPEKIAEAQARISSDWYSRPEVLDALGDSLSSSPMARVAAREVGQQAPADPTGYRPELMQEVSDKLRSGFYSDSEVMGFVADRLSDIYGIQ
ncbi:MAG: flagellar biosynthesis anti-sigma factor FlgM [Calditrichaeota bacterium]|nr:flagellar biosynthesis anti-sigma factor FlgM [Candidatus Cloacimonadota bacterium]MCA9786995.1 flagellar biosynthesis anti-sigma factor FlgM [Candidatus Cloacimonadota bacterium]MCB1047050.1 flagellar biosynthesis anti-sigma factor FlgM [Calditrichota bacterium]MCB9475094.1 flagellar biosynthesis anti-sigma factor FlgM [Candidatus Delongbacteria bacterium]